MGENFRAETRAWLEENCPPSMRTRMVPGEEIGGGSKRRSSNPDAYLWLERMAERGWTVPTWPVEYGGGGLDKDDFLVLLEELQRIRARPPLGGMGVTMIGPTLLEHGTEDQKQRHLPKIARGEVAWCQGYSEPGAGSDLASLKTRAEDQGDHYLVNGSKIWTSGAQYADWIFCLVRTDPNVPKHNGISFLLFSMDDPGVTVKPIELINGNSPFCQTFFDDVRVPKNDLVGEENQGWTVAKRLLQHERSGLAALASADTAGPLERIQPSLPLPDLAKSYENGGQISDPGAAYRPARQRDAQTGLPAHPATGGGRVRSQHARRHHFHLQLRGSGIREVAAGTADAHSGQSGARLDGRLPSARRRSP